MRPLYIAGARVLWRRSTGELVFAEVVRPAHGVLGRDEQRFLLRHPDGEACVWASELEPDPSQPVRLLKR